MTFREKISAWVVDYGHMIRGSLYTVVYRKPPRHYLGHVVSGKAPVILIPGILGRWSFMKKLGDAISLAGHPVYVVPDLGYNLHKIPSSAKILHTLLLDIFRKQKREVKGFSHRLHSIKNVIKTENLSGVVLVAHSKGGLIGKYLLSHLNADHRVLGMVTIATPFSGSAMAKLIPHNAFGELHEDSEIIHDLEKHIEVNSQIISIAPEFDNHVWSERGSFLEGAENLKVPTRGHHAVLFSDAVIQLVLDSIKKIEK